jgi:hypothetical protein
LVGQVIGQLIGQLVGQLDDFWCVGFGISWLGFGSGRVRLLAAPLSFYQESEIVRTIPCPWSYLQYTSVDSL